MLNPSNQLDSYILIIGNNYLHKYITPTVDALSSAFPDKKILVIGEKNHIKNNVIFYKSGLIDEKFINKAYCNAQFVICPSHYEGFGFPLIKSLAYHKPVMVKESELWQEMKIRLKNENIFFYQTTQDLINQLKSNGFPISTKIASSNENDGWERSANEMADFFSKLCEDKNNLVQNISLRIEHLQLLQKREDNNNFLKLRSVTQIRYSLKIKSFFAQVFWKIKTQNAMRICKKSPLFDRAWYMNEYPDVVISGQDPILHYIKYGAKEGRDPGPIFSTSNYFIAHPEIIKTGINPLVHHAYVIKGRKPRH